MANPTPTINQINAFNATQGTIIDFNIIGGTELVRSNRIYIYDLSDNSLICTHLYVSTESIHELPANTDSSIVYESGKSSADFVNGAQYYAQIQTYTDTAGTEGGSGLSVAKMFWCLVDPTLTITTIPSTISTTSYNVSATYDANTSVVSNIIQQYQFSLYSATGSLLQSSGVIVGSGTQQGTSTAYDISYNFTGLSVGSSYYVVVDVTTTQGMSVSTQSNTFTVSIETPTLGEATVVNNACDGYISVTSNLSSEYGGSASGEIATFETDSVNDVSSLKVTLTPQQDGTPWIGTDHDTTPYLNRAMPTQSNDYNRESGVIVGGTVAWNQLMQNGDFADGTSHWDTDGHGTITVDNGVLSFIATAQYGAVRNTITFIENHKYALFLDIKGDANISSSSLNLYNGSGVYFANPTVTTSWARYGSIANHNKATAQRYLNLQDNRTSGWTGIQLRNVVLIDLTAMFGTPIADRAYTLEQSTAGSGIAWLRSYGFLTEDYYEYTQPTLESVRVSGHDTVGFNQWDEIAENGYYDKAGGTAHSSSNFIRSKNAIRCLPNTTYRYTNSGSGSFGAMIFYDSNDSYIGYTESLPDGLFTTPSNAGYMRFYCGKNQTNICINISKTTGSPQNGDYVAYDGHSYPLDSSLTLRGIPKLDASNNLYYDGDTYESDGTVTRKYGVVDLGTLTWSFIDNYSANFMMATLSTAKANTLNMVCGKGYKPLDSLSAVLVEDKSMVVISSTIRIRDDSYSDAASFKSAMSGVYLVYELATPTTEQATAYTNPQIVDPDGTEEYVTSNYVPVGHDSTYSLVCPISGHDEVNVDVVGKNLCDNSVFGTWANVTEQTDGSYYCVSNSYVYQKEPWKNEKGVSGSIKIIYRYKNANTSLDVGLFPVVRYTDGTQSTMYALATPSTTYREITLTTDNSKTVDYIYFTYASKSNSTNFNLMVTTDLSSTAYEPYQGQTYTADLPQTVYGGTVDVVTGELVVDRAMVDLGTLNWTKVTTNIFRAVVTGMHTYLYGVTAEAVCDRYKVIQTSYNDPYISGNGLLWAYVGLAEIRVKDTAYNDASAFKASVSGSQFCYKLATPITYQLTPQEIQAVVGENNVWSDAGEVEITYNIPITNLLVKRQDVADVSGSWLTLYSQPVTQASDMDFTFIDFLNQYGKTYKYALVPLLTQTQSGVEVEVEGGYTVSDEVQSIFDGVFIADSTGSQKCKANVGYGDVDMNQAVGTITPIGAKYPVVITNSKNQYHNGSISGTIVPDDYYFNGNLSRIDMVNKRNELEQFLTNKRAKIIKDWNSNIWLVMIMDNINCTFNNEYGMGIVNFTANWIEVGDPTNQQDLQATGLIDVGGV